MVKNNTISTFSKRPNCHCYHIKSYLRISNTCTVANIHIMTFTFASKNVNFKIVFWRATEGKLAIGFS